MFDNERVDLIGLHAMIQAHIRRWIYIVPSSLNTIALLTWCHDAHTVISLVVASSSPLDFLIVGVILLLPSTFYKYAT
jgi:hypothetical protein